jgi:hypothetical protein
MPVWRCPHCGTPQAEAARCWVCRRSSTSCATCVNFRHAVFGGMGYCGLDRGRSALAGDEIRPCWVAPTALMAEAVAVQHAPDEQPFSVGGAETGPLTSERPTRFWVEVEG